MLTSNPIAGCVATIKNICQINNNIPKTNIPNQPLWYTERANLLTKLSVIIMMIIPTNPSSITIVTQVVV